MFTATVSGERLARLGPAEGVAPVQVVAHRALPRQRAVAVGVHQDDPAVAGLRHQHRERVGVVAVAVDVGRRQFAEGALVEQAAVPGAGGVERPHPAHPAQRDAADAHRVARRVHRA